MNYKSDCKQILEYVTSEKERFGVYWRAWKKAALEVVNEEEFTNSIRIIINDLLSSKKEYRNEIEDELIEMIKGQLVRVSNRAQQLYHELFER